MSTPLAYLPKVRSPAITQAARGMPCALRLPGVCCHDEATVVLAHLPGAGNGMGTKSSDLHGVFACRSCHDHIDRLRDRDDATVLAAMLRGLAETQARLVEAGIISVKGARIK